MTTYCMPDDLLTGDVPVKHADSVKFVQAATDEINARISAIYVLPITGVEEPSRLHLKRACQLIATGRYLLAAATANEDGSPHAYGKWCLQEGKDILEKIACGEIPLMGAVRREEQASEGNAPRTIVADLHSPVETFYSWATRGEEVFWRPGL